MVETLLIALIFSKLELSLRIGYIKIQKKSYSIKPIFKRWSIYPVIFMSLFYVFLQFQIINQNYYFLQYQHIIKNMIIMSYMILGFDVLFRYEVYKPFIFACASLLSGCGLNYLAMYFNNSKMPIFPSMTYATGYTNYDMLMKATEFGDFHVLGDCSTNLIFLCDVFDIFGFSIWSIGDVLCRLYAFIMVYYFIKTVNLILKTSKK